MTNIKQELDNIIELINKRVNNIKPFLPIILSIIQMKIDENFAKEGRWNGSNSGINLLSGGSKRWTPLAPQTIANYKRSKKIRPNAKILSRSGLLRKQIGYKSTDSKIIITSGVPYAAIHQFGGRIKHPGGTPYIMSKSNRIQFISKKKADQLKKKNKPVFYTKKHTIVIPPRPYIVLSETDIAEIIDRLKGYIMN